MLWLERWKRDSLAGATNLEQLHGEDLSEEKTRTEIQKARIEILDERSWRTKLLVSLLLPLGGALAFLNTWHKDHLSDQQHQSDQLYTEAAQQLGSTVASVRLNAVLTLSSFVTERGWLAQRFEPDKAFDCGRYESVRGRQSVGLIVGHLVEEKDASVLDAISKVADAHPCLTVQTLLNVNRSASVDFSRAAGTFAGLFLLHEADATVLQDDPVSYNRLRQKAINDIDNVTLRTGSPFEAKDMMNESFVSRTFLSAKCPFLGIFDKQLRLTGSVGLSGALIAKPPNAAKIQTALQVLIDSAAVLEKSSYVIAEMANTDRGLAELRRAAADQNLYGVAIVVGEIKSPSTSTELRNLGAYVQQLGVDGVCVIPKSNPNLK